MSIRWCEDSTVRQCPPAADERRSRPRPKRDEKKRSVEKNEFVSRRTIRCSSFPKTRSKTFRSSFFGEIRRTSPTGETRSQHRFPTVRSQMVPFRFVEQISTLVRRTNQRLKRTDRSVRFVSFRFASIYFVVTNIGDETNG